MIANILPISLTRNKLGQPYQGILIFSDLEEVIIYSVLQHHVEDFTYIEKNFYKIKNFSNLPMWPRKNLINSSWKTAELNLVFKNKLVNK